MNQPTQPEKLLELAKGREVISMSEIRQAGVADAIVGRSVKAGKLERITRGLYRIPDAPISEHHDLIQVMAQADQAVIVLISALRFHELGTQQPSEVWIQIPANARTPKITWPPIKVVRTRLDSLFIEGVEEHVLSGVHVAITSPSRTVVDCFKHRSLVGMDVCIEALRELLHRDRNAIRDLDRYAKINRVSNVMRPYLEAMQ